MAVSWILACGGDPAVEPRTDPVRVFEAAKGEARIDFLHRNGMIGENYFVEMMGAGAALFDFDRDGDLDAYLTQGAPLGAGAEEASRPGGRLFVNRLIEDGSLSWQDETESRGLQPRDYGNGVAVGDVDGDGLLDLYLTNFGPNQLFLGTAEGDFEEVPSAGGTADPRWSASAAFFDYDQDGDLDLYVTNYVDFSLQRPRKCSGPSGRGDYCSPNSYRAEPDSLYRNRANERSAPDEPLFEDVTVSSGVARHYGNGLGVVTSDFDADGWLDIYVANDLEPNLFWRNQGDGTFRDEAMLFGVAVNADGKAEAGMGLIAADVDRDGDEDLFLTHLVGESNTLYVNQSGALFLDQTQASGLALPSVKSTGFGVVAGDYDNNGSLDIAVANGAVTVVEEQEMAGSSFPLVMPNQLFLQHGGEFVEQLLLEDAPQFVSRGIAQGDVDNDGDLDLLVMNNHGPAELLINRVGQGRRWLGFRAVELVGADTHRDAYGAKLKLTLEDGAVWTGRVTAEGGYLSSHDARVLFGLGDGSERSAEASFELEVCWVASSCELFALQGLDRYHSVVRGQAGAALQGTGG